MEVVKFENAEKDEPEEQWLRVSLAEKDAVSVEYFEKPHGHSSPMHGHKQRQICLVVQGTIKVYTSDEEVALEKMDAAFLKGNEKHRVENVGDSKAIGFDIFVPGRSFHYWTNRSKNTENS